MPMCEGPERRGSRRCGGDHGHPLPPTRPIPLILSTNLWDSLRKSLLSAQVSGRSLIPAKGVDPMKSIPFGAMVALCVLAFSDAGHTQGALPVPIDRGLPSGLDGGIVIAGNSARSVRLT